HLDAPQMVAHTPVGGRKIVLVTGGTFEGERLSGKVLPGGGDWALTRGDGSLVLDVRLTLEAGNGDLIYMTYRGVRHGPDEVMKRLSAGEVVNPSEYYFRIAPLFETASERYGWLNRIVCVGSGERLKQGPRYTVFEML
ncbi:MAG: DUF3237 domain-containing protein, partial [Rhodospirillaceae bacterium]|nr:DUF3237 domain-containing protein [Rhodospirillaceae bacterium]